MKNVHVDIETCAKFHGYCLKKSNFSGKFNIYNKLIKFIVVLCKKYSISLPIGVGRGEEVPVDFVQVVGVGIIVLNLNIMVVILDESSEHMHMCGVKLYHLSTASH